MRSEFVAFVAILAVLLSSVLSAQGNAQSRATGIYAFTMKDIDGKDLPLENYRGKVLLIVNTASKCGYTPQYESLETLYMKYHDKGFEILAFPANNFGGQEPGTDAEIKEFCSTTYNVTFPLFSKISVKGDDIDPLYGWLTKSTGHDGEIRWNFEKFLVDRNGMVVSRFATRIDPMDDEIREAVELHLIGE